MKILIIGITGFAGRAAKEMLLAKGVGRIYGTYRHSTINRAFAQSNPQLDLYECDINDVISIENVLNLVKPNIILHFAAYVSVFSAFKNPILTFKTNTLGTLNLLESVRRIVPDSKVLLPGSAEEYGFVNIEKMPIKESYDLNPVNPYAISKKNQEEIGLYYHSQLGLNVYFTRTFHCTGPYQPPGFVCSDVARQIVSFERGFIDSIKLGNLEAKRDFTDIRDVIMAYWLILTRGNPGEIYNVCIGESISIQQVVDRLISISGKELPIELDHSKLRKADVSDFVGCNQKIRNIGWSPKFNIQQSLSDLLDWTRGSD